MANELIINYPTGATLYALLFDATGNVWNGSSFVAPGSANWTDYDIAMTEVATATGLYRASMPAAVAGVYGWTVRKQAGGSPAVSDVAVGVGRIEWTGTAEIMPASTTNITAGTINSVLGTVSAQLANGVVHGGADAELRLKKVVVNNTDNGGTAVLLASASPYAAGKGLDIRGMNGGKGIEISGLVEMDLGERTQGDIADALRFAPSGTDPETGSVYDLLANVGTGSGTVEPAQLDWSAWTTPGGALADLYDDNAVDALTSSGTTLTAEGDTGFAAWVLQEFDGKLFVGVGKTPLNHIAAVIGSIATAGAAPTFEYALPEEGVSAMTVGSDGKLYVAGADERANTGDSSIYIRTAAGAWTRKQTVTNTQHIFGMCFVGTRLWVAGQGNPDGILYSDDYGDTWNLGGLGPSQRYYDIIALGSALIVQAWDPLPWWPVYRTTNYGGSWNQVVGIESGTGRMVVWQGVIIGVSNTGKLFTVDSSGTGTEYTPPFTPRQTYNNLAVDTDGYLCVLGTTGVWRTNDLANWKQVWSFSPADTVRGLGTWGDNLVVSTDGATAQVLARPASPETAQQQMLRDALKLAASPGTAAAGSTDADIADILTDTAAIKAITDDIDVSAVTLATGNNAGDLTFIVGATFDETLTGLTVIPSDWTACIFSLKREKDSDSDSASLIQIKATNGSDASDGLLYAQGSAPTGPITKASASLTVTQAAGTVRIVVSAAAMALLTGGLSSLDWDLKVFKTGGWSKVVTSGNASIAWTPTRAV